MNRKCPECGGGIRGFICLACNPGMTDLRFPSKEDREAEDAAGELFLKDRANARFRVYFRRPNDGSIIKRFDPFSEESSARSWFKNQVLSKKFNLVYLVRFYDMNLQEEDMRFDILLRWPETAEDIDFGLERVREALLK